MMRSNCSSPPLAAPICFGSLPPPEALSGITGTQGQLDEGGVDGWVVTDELNRDAQRIESLQAAPDRRGHLNGDRSGLRLCSGDEPGDEASRITRENLSLRQYHDLPVLRSAEQGEQYQRSADRRAVGLDDF